MSALFLGLILSVVHLKWRLFTTHLGVFHLTKWHVLPIIIHKHLLPLHLSLSSLTPLSSFMLFDSHFTFSHHLIISILFCSQVSCLIIITYNFDFLFCPLEENFHTYLTTWLSLCSVTIFFELITIISK